MKKISLVVAVSTLISIINILLKRMELPKKILQHKTIKNIRTKEKCIIQKKVANCTAPKKLDTIWGYFYGKKSQV